MQSWAIRGGKTFPLSQTYDNTPSSARKYHISQKQITAHDEQILHHISIRNYTQALVLLHELSDEIQFDNKLEETVKYYRMYICFYNLGVVSWRMKKFQEAEKFLCEAINFLDITLSYCEYKEEHLVFSFEMIKLELQHCVVLSQNGRHVQAIQICDRAIHRLFQCFKTKLLMANQMMLELKKKSKHQRKNRIDFKNIVLKEAKQKLIYLSELEQSYQLIDSTEQQLHQIIKMLYTWKNNLENNEKFIRKSLNIIENREHRNILGISKIPDWIETFNIGTIMALNPQKIDFLPNFDTFLLLSADKILQLVIYTSAAYFTLSTEIRFNELEDETKELTNSQRIIKMNDSSRILQCKVLHLKAIQLASRFMPNSSQYILHLISSFNKNYKFYMQKIDEENQNLIDSNSNKKSNISKSKQQKIQKSKSSEKQKLKMTSKRKSKSKTKDHSMTQLRWKPKNAKIEKQYQKKSRTPKIKTDIHSKSRSKQIPIKHKNSVSSFPELKSSLTIRK